MPRLASQYVEIPQQGPEQLEEKPELKFDPGELAPCWASPYADAELSEKAENELKRLCDMLANVDVAARRWEVEQAWQARLFQRGYQFLWPRRGGGWIYIPFATDYNLRQSRWGSALHGNETNIYATYQEIICAAITRDIPRVRFKPDDPDSDVDITFADAASRYSRLFGQMVDLKQLHQQLAYYLATDGRALIVMDHVIDAQRFGRERPIDELPVVPETEAQEAPPAAYLVRHGDTVLNESDKARGRLEAPLEERGERETDRAAQWLKDKGVQLILTSPVKRALESAQRISDALQVPFEVDDRLASLDIGDKAGEDKQTVLEDIEEAFEGEGNEPIDGGETANEFRARVQAAIMDAVSRGTLVAIVTHDSVITEVFRMFQEESSQEVPPGGVAALVPQSDGTFKPSVVFPCFASVPESGERRGPPRGREVATVYGKLEHKVPMNAQCMEDCLWVQLSKEYDVAYVKAMFPDKAAKIRAGGSVAGENELDRIARINAVLALEASYVTGDSMVRDCTVQRTWMRPGMFMEVQDTEVREELLEKFPDGVLVIQGSDIFLKSRNESMDDHLTLVHAFPGTGMNRLALCSKLESVQKRLNNWVELLDQFLTRCVPMRYADSKAFDLEALRDQPGSPGDYIPFLLDQVAPNRNVQDLIWQEPFPVHQPSMPDFIRMFTYELPQLLAHALPALFGGQDNTDTATGAVIQRDQALGCLLTPWWNIQVATASYHKQAVQLAARCRHEAIIGTDKASNRIRIELSEMKGNIAAYPEDDANFPESWTQKQQRYQQMIMDAASNPLVGKLLSSISNLRLAKDMAGFDEFKIPEADCYEKQMGEFELLLAQSPLPNPKRMQAEQAIAAQAQQMQALQAVGNMVPPQQIQQLAQAQQQMQAIPQLTSSVQIRPTDDHKVEAQACLDYINSPQGRRLANGTQKEQLGFQNLTLHYNEHTAAAPPDVPIGHKPMTVSASVKDLPPDAAAKALTEAGLEASGQDIVGTRVFQSELKKASKVSPTGERT